VNERTSTASELLGYPAGARVLIVNCDDFGMHEGVNTAVIDSMERGIAGSCSLMVVCPATPRAMRLLRDRPGTAFGIHLTLVRDSPEDRWAPRSARHTVPSLLDDTGEFHTNAERARLLARARPAEVEREFRAQLDVVLDAGLSPTHLDFHCLADGGREDILELTMALAAEHGLAARVWLDRGRRTARSRGLPVVDNDFLDSFALDVDGKQDHYAHLLRTLPAGLTEWAVHPGLTDDPVRRTDHQFLTSPQARELLDQENIEVVDYRAIQRIWAAGGEPPGENVSRS
jgi:chitin disaccharide deacetylase